jgi:hypothetical protein
VAREPKRVVKTITLFNKVRHDVTIVEETVYYKPQLIHHHQVICSRVVARMGEEAMPYAIDGELISCDTDELVVMESARAQEVPLKESGNTHPFGTLLRKDLTNIHDIKPRSYRSDQKSKTPGVPHKENTHDLGQRPTSTKELRRVQENGTGVHGQNAEERLLQSHRFAEGTIGDRMGRVHGGTIHRRLVFITNTIFHERPPDTPEVLSVSSRKE